MVAAIGAASSVRLRTSPNPWVGVVLVDQTGTALATGATEPPGGRHAEIVALDALESMGRDPAGMTLVTTLEPCCHRGRTPPCVERIIEAGVRRVVIGVLDPDPQVAGRGVHALGEAGIDVTIGVAAAEIEDQLRAYLHHRRTGRPYVVCKLAATLDGATAAPDGSSQWITGEAARHDAHRLRAESDAILVGAGTVRADDPALTVRHLAGPDPRRVVLGKAPPDARVHPCLEWNGGLGDLLDRLGSEDVLQLMIEGGPTVAGAFHDARLIDRYVLYVAPALVGNDRGLSLLAGSGANALDDVWRGRIDRVEQLGVDLRIDIVPSAASHRRDDTPNSTQGAA